jgi:hypothetical protein
VAIVIAKKEFGDPWLVAGFIILDSWATEEAPTLLVSSSVASCSRSRQSFRPLSVLKLLGMITVRNRCMPTTFPIITAEDVDGWCHNGPV